MKLSIIKKLILPVVLTASLCPAVQAGEQYPRDDRGWYDNQYGRPGGDDRYRRPDNDGRRRDNRRYRDDRRRQDNRWEYGYRYCDKNHISLTGILNTADAWQLEFTYHRMLCPYVGIGGSIGVWRQTAYNGYPSGNGWYIDPDDEKARNLYLQPSLLLRTPSLVKLTDVDFLLFAEPGFMMNIPYDRVSIITTGQHSQGYDEVSSSSGKWCAFSLKLGVTAKFDRVELSAGYLFSTLDACGLRREISYRDRDFSEFYDVCDGVHGAFLSVSYNF